MRFGNKLAAIVGFATLLAGSALVSDRAVAATVLYDNLSGASNGSDPVANFQPDYNSFSTGGSAMLLNSVSVLLGGNSASGGTFNIGLYADNGGNAPGSLVSSLGGSYSDSALSSSLTPFSAAFSAVSLAANTRYWIGLTASNDSSVLWSFAGSNSGTGVAGEFYSDPLGTFSNDAFLEPYQMAVSATDIVATTPVPASLVLFATGLAGLGVFGARRKKAGSIAG